MNPRGLALRPQQQQQIHLCTRQTIRVPSSATRPRGPTNHQLGKKAAYARAPEARGLALRHQPRQQTTSPYTRGLALRQRQVHRCTRHATRVPSSTRHRRLPFAGLIRDSEAECCPRRVDSGPPLRLPPSTPVRRVDCLYGTTPPRRLRSAAHK